MLWWLMIMISSPVFFCWYRGLRLRAENSLWLIFCFSLKFTFLFKVFEFHDLLYQLRNAFLFVLFGSKLKRSHFSVNMLLNIKSNCHLSSSCTGRSAVSAPNWYACAVSEEFCTTKECMEEVTLFFFIWIRLSPLSHGGTYLNSLLGLCNSKANQTAQTSHNFTKGNLATPATQPLPNFGHINELEPLLAFILQPMVSRSFSVVYLQLWIYFGGPLLHVITTK